MYAFMYKMFAFLIKLVFCAVFVSGLSSKTGNEFLLRKGWYKTSHKGPKILFNNITHIDNQLINATTYLQLRGRITTIFSGGIRNLEQVSTMKITFCGTEELLPGAFQNLSNLATLALSDNEIREVKSGVFNKLNLTVLFLQRNEIETIESTAFNNMPNLYRIKLNTNKISIWDSNWFQYTPRITELFFRRNLITEIPQGAFKNIKGSHSLNDQITVDTKIYLSKNKISKIEVNAFQNFTEFSQLWLDRNELEEIDENIFAPLIQVGGIFLSRNQISKLPDGLFPNLKTDILTLDLVGNNNLTCVPYGIVSKVKIVNLQGVKKLDCKCIRDVVKKLVSEKKKSVIKSKCVRSDF